MNSAAQILVFLVDDHTLFRKGLKELVDHSPQLKVAGCAANAVDAKRQIAEIQPDVVLLDLDLPPVSGLALLAELRAAGYERPIVMLTVSDAQEDLARCLQAGARGYLLKDMEPEDLMDAVQRAHRGETVVAPSMTLKLVGLLQGTPSGGGASLLELLTGREREILSHLARGESNKVIARALDISHDTVKLHVRHILSKLNLSSRVQAAVFAVEHKLAPPVVREPERPRVRNQ